MIPSISYSPHGFDFAPGEAAQTARGVAEIGSLSAPPHPNKEIMSKYEDRAKLTLEEALKLKREPTNKISHLIKNSDETYSLVYHINCEFCDYCQAESEVNNSDTLVHLAKEDIYETVER